MSKNLAQILLIILFTGLCFAVGAFLAQRGQKKRKARRRASRSSDTLPLSAFSTFDHPAGQEDKNQANPLSEAQVFMIYGKKEKAREVLNTALAKRRITQADVDAFWSQYPS
jgi:hypothetical protein